MKLHFLVVALSSIVLTACGGSNAPVVLQTPEVKPTTTTTTTSDTVAKTTKFGESYVVQKGTTTTKTATVETVENNVQNLNHLIIYIADYKNQPRHTYQFTDSNPTFNAKDYGNHDITNIGTSMSYARYGMVSDEFAEHNVAFYQGHQTLAKDMPSTSEATYKGYSIYGCKTCGDDFKTGNATIIANFANKTVTGYLAGVGAAGSYGAISATISGNTFSGSTAGGTNTKGAFFGPKAEEVAGIFSNDTLGTLGSFGGKQ